MCIHKNRLNKNDKDFLKKLRITPFECPRCEGKEPPKLRVEKDKE